MTGGTPLDFSAFDDETRSRIEAHPVVLTARARTCDFGQTAAVALELKSGERRLITSDTFSKAAAATLDWLEAHHG